ncbi:MAG: diaminopimelate epimerase [Ruminococcaceae bacterium]|nr:diaminopimelate epimerase [Oscillospiraceae bacterium]
MKFTKMHGIGNDYIYVNCFCEQVEDPAAVAQLLSQRRFAVGADGLILICPSEVADFQMVMYNADGSRGKMCGNGIRCVGKYVYDRGLTDKTIVTVETLGGIKTLDFTLKDGVVDSVRVDMGAPIWQPEQVPVIFSGEKMLDAPLTVEGKTWQVSAVSMGNPHLVTFVADVDSLNLEEIGPHFECHEVFPERVNTEFIQILDRENLKMRVWERGSGETWACGTGACASFVVANAMGYCGKAATLHLRGGDLLIELAENGHILMSGPASFVYDGETLML